MKHRILTTAYSSRPHGIPRLGAWRRREFPSDLVIANRPEAAAELLLHNHGMIGNRITHRIEDGVRIRGTWRPVFVKDGDYYLTDLIIYADGLISCREGLITVEGLEETLQSGRVATTLPEGAWAAVEDLAAWKFSDAKSVTPDLLIAEVRDTLDQLNGRPDSADRCMEAVHAFLADQTEEKRAAARAAFLAVPRRHRILGDMDRKDWPLRMLLAGPGGHTYRFPKEPPVTQEHYDQALAYFGPPRPTSQRGTSDPADGPVASHAPPVRIRYLFPQAPVPKPNPRSSLHNNYPAPITLGEATYPSVTYAYWALSIASPQDREAVATADTFWKARTHAMKSPRHDGWEHVRTAVMTRLLRAKYDQHPELAETLLATGDATLVYDEMDSAFWGNNSGQGRNWNGRLHELIRSELHLRRTGALGL
ncbi:NADAR family protein [Streptomyces fructofermentans]|uniref:NADAR family protein n=1 Tax=Streptomyces fructofermentans TaxID=152141 RepID=UPI0033C9F16D